MLYNARNTPQLMTLGRNLHWQISLCQSESQTGFPASMSEKSGICASLMPAIDEKAVRKSLTAFSVPLLLDPVLDPGKLVRLEQKDLKPSIPTHNILDTYLS